MNCNPLNTSTHRQCNICREIKELSESYFLKNKALKYGLSYTCKVCERSRARKVYHKFVTPERKQAAKEYAAVYRKTLYGMAWERFNAYRRMDKKRAVQNDLSPEWIQEEILSKPCIYCGEEGRSGCDRLDNSKGHTKDNVVPSCGDCNVARGDRFTHEEMRVIGAAMRLVKAARKTHTKL